MIWNRLWLNIRPTRSACVRVRTKTVASKTRMELHAAARSSVRRKRSGFVRNYRGVNLRQLTSSSTVSPSIRIIQWEA